MLNIELGGVVVSMDASYGIKQTYEKDLGAITRMASGAGIRLSTPLGKKIKTTITAAGIRPSGIGAIDYEQPLLLKCAEAVAVQGAGGTRVINIPSARRSDPDYEPAGIAIINGRHVRVGIDSSAGDQYTVTQRAGAEAYEVLYFPQITVLAELKSTGSYSWTITAEEV